MTLQLQPFRPQASASVSTTPSAKLRLSGARRSCSLQVKDHLQASWISRAGAAAARFPAGGPPGLCQERQVRRRGSRQSPELGALGLPNFFAPDRTITTPTSVCARTCLKGTDESIDRGGVVVLQQPTPERPKLLYYQKTSQNRVRQQRSPWSRAVGGQQQLCGSRHSTVEARCSVLQSARA